MCRLHGGMNGKLKVENLKLKTENWKLKALYPPSATLVPLSQGDKVVISVLVNFLPLRQGGEEGLQKKQ